MVFAGARNPSAATELQALARAYPGKVHPIALISCDQETHAAAIKEIKKVAGRLDVVVANAGPQILFQATYPLLKTSTPVPKFIVITSIAGSIALGPSMPALNGAYTVSKAAVNYLARKLHFENEGLSAWAFFGYRIAVLTLFA
ncbi:hypothetical protein HWV62_31975 [Athelia sp. TMB]|nr:hypothetical protein HWV62_31975 [Athelia sp. TMB]